MRAQTRAQTFFQTRYPLRPNGLLVFTSLIPVLRVGGSSPSGRATKKSLKMPKNVRFWGLFV